MKKKKRATAKVDQLKLDEFPTRSRCAGPKEATRIGMRSTPYDLKTKE